MKQLCASCQEVLRKNDDISLHENLLAIQAKEMETGQTEYIFFCKNCIAFIQFVVSSSHSLDRNIEPFPLEQVSEELMKKAAIALYAEERKIFIQSRIEFLKRKRMPVFEPIKEEDLEQLVELHTSNVYRLPSFYTYQTGKSNEDETWWIGYADTKDYCLVQPSSKVPRFYRSYLIPSQDANPLVVVGLNQSPRICLWMCKVSMIYQLAIWDALEEKHMDPQKFASTVRKEDLWMEFSEETKQKMLESYLIQLKTLLHVS